MQRNGDIVHYNDPYGITYTCQSGYSFDANNVSDVTQTVHCLPDGALQSLSPSECTGWHFFHQLSVLGEC